MDSIEKCQLLSKIAVILGENEIKITEASFGENDYEYSLKIDAYGSPLTFNEAIKPQLQEE